MQKPLVIGCFGRAFGVQGWIHLNSFTSPKGNILKLIPWRINRNGVWQDITIHGNRFPGLLPDRPEQFGNCARREESVLNIHDRRDRRCQQSGKPKCEGYIEASRFHDQDIVIKLSDCSDRDIANTYTNCQIVIDREQLPTLTTKEYYWTDLEGLKVINLENIELGIVDHLFATAANDILVVKDIDLQKKTQRLIPFIKDVVLEVDLEKQIIHVDWDMNF